MKECRIISIMLVTVLIFSELIFPLQGAAQEPLALGEIKASDGVKTESSNGKWIEMPKVYPLFKTTKLMTNNGVVFITTREGSRIDFSRETEVTIDAINASYSVNLVHGTVSFNMAPNSTLNIDTKDAHISVAPQVADYHSLVAGAGAPALKNVKGIVTSADATYIRSIAGKINVSGKTFQARVLDTGETFFASAEGKEKPLGYNAANSEISPWVLRGIVGGVVVTGGTIIAVESLRSRNGVVSNSGF